MFLNGPTINIYNGRSRNTKYDFIIKISTSYTVIYAVFIKFI